MSYPTFLGVASGIGDQLKQWATFAQLITTILAGMIAVLGVPLALRQVINLQRELRLTNVERERRLDAEANLNITAHSSLTHAAPIGHVERPQPRRGDGAERTPAANQPPPPAPQPGKRVLRLDLTLENVGERTVDVLACLVAARELEDQGEGVAAEGRDAQWEDLTRHYWNDTADPFSPGLSTTKHCVYSQDALVRIKAHSRKALARVDQVSDFTGEKYLLYRAFVAARRASRNVADLESWAALQRALLNVNAPAFRAAGDEENPLGLVASPDGWRLFLHHYHALADPKFGPLRARADREERAVADPAEHERARARLDAELQEYCRRNLLPAWRAYRADLERMARDGRGFSALLRNPGFARRQRDVEKRFPWGDQEVWVEYFYVITPS